MKPSRSSASQAYELLLQAIEAGTLRPKTRLREAELAARFKISRTPVREALKRLESQGLVVHEAHHGAVVASLDYSQTAELYFVREILEGAAAGLAAIHATPTEIEVLKEMVQRDKKLINHPDKLAINGTLIGRQIANSARNRFLMTMLDNLRLSFALLGGKTLLVPARTAEALEERAAVVACIAARDSEGAEAKARAHVRLGFRERIKLRQVTETGAPGELEK